MDVDSPSCDKDGDYEPVQFVWSGYFYCQSKDGTFSQFARENKIRYFYKIQSFIKKVRNLSQKLVINYDS